MDGRALGVEDAAAEDRRGDAPATSSARQRDRLLRPTDARRGGRRLLDRGVLRRRGGHLEHPGLAQPDVLPATPRPTPGSPGMIRSPARASSSARSSPSTGRIDASDAQ